MRRIISVLLIIFAVGCSNDGDKTTTTTTSTTATPPVTTAEPSTTVPVPVSVPPSEATSYLTNIQVVPAGKGDKVTFTFSGTLPGYSIEYIKPPLEEDGSGNPVSIKGAAIVKVMFAMASAYNLNTGSLTYTGPNKLTPNGTAVVEVAKAGDFESHLTWGIGTNGAIPFIATPLPSSNQIVIEFTK